MVETLLRAYAQIIDEEVKTLQSYARTKSLEANMDKVSAVAERLLEKETINVDDVVELIGPRPFLMPRTCADFMVTHGKLKNLRKEGEQVMRGTDCVEEKE